MILKTSVDRYMRSLTLSPTFYFTLWVNALRCIQLRFLG